VRPAASLVLMKVENYYCSMLRAYQEMQGGTSNLGGGLGFLSLASHSLNSAAFASQFRLLFS
jgi:hypothetical protein